MDSRKKKIYFVLLNLILAGILTLSAPHLALLRNFHWKIYDSLVKAKKRIQAPPKETEDIVIVGIDNTTIKKMPHAWPYPRTDFAQVIANLKKADPRVIAFDFAFFGASSMSDDKILTNELNTPSAKIVLSSIINEDGTLTFPTMPDLSREIPSGIVTKIQDSDGITRKNISYLVNAEKRQQGFLSWEMQILIQARSVDLSTLEILPSHLFFENGIDEKWLIPLTSHTNSFLINFRVHTADLKRLSFYDVHRGEFDKSMIRNKIVLVGLLSSMLQDIHHTPIGWLPGITLNANAFLTLYAQDFIKSVPSLLETSVLLLGVFLAVVLAMSLHGKRLFFYLAAEILFFWAVSGILLCFGYTWNYAVFPAVIALCPLAVRKIIRL